MRLLVLAPEPVGPRRVIDALGEDVRGAEVRVVAPALNQSSVAFWVSDSDEAIAEAEKTQRETVDALAGEVGSVSGDTGESEPLVALQDALATFRADRILVFVHPEDERRYREDELAGEAESRFGVPVTLAALR